MSHHTWATQGSTKVSPSPKQAIGSQGNELGAKI